MDLPVLLDNAELAYHKAHRPAYLKASAFGIRDSALVEAVGELLP